MKREKGFVVQIVLLVILALVIGFGYFFYQRFKSSSPDISNIKNTVNQSVDGAKQDMENGKNQAIDDAKNQAKDAVKEKVKEVMGE